MNKLVTCPYDEVHKVKESRLSLHIAKCRLNHLDEDKFTCPFNATHVVPHQERNYHLAHCEDRAPLDRLLASGQDRNNPFRGNTAVPSYTESTVPAIADECWDDEYYAPPPISSKPPPACAIIEPPALAKPAERKKLYNQLHRMPAEIERLHIDKAPAQPHKVVPSQPAYESMSQAMSRQPIAACKVVEIKKHNEFQSVGVGRGTPANSQGPPNTTRIAAKIFDPSTKQEPKPVSNSGNYSAALTAGMSNLGLGRGYSAGLANNSQLNDEEFPALGRGRAYNKGNKNGGARYPNSRS